MVVKGHHFPRVTLVGVIAAESSLNIDDYRAGERTFQILTQVAGRAGRENLPGKVIIQTYNPDHFSIEKAKEQNYEEFYNTEILLRKQLKYPPFCDIILIGVVSQYEETAIKEINNLYMKLLKLQNNNIQIFKPAPFPISKINKKFRWRIIIKCKLDNTILENINNIINIDNIKNSVKYIDINPYNLS